MRKKWLSFTFFNLFVILLSVIFFSGCATNFKITLSGGNGFTVKKPPAKKTVPQEKTEETSSSQDKVEETTTSKSIDQEVTSSSKKTEETTASQDVTETANVTEIKSEEAARPQKKAEEQATPQKKTEGVTIQGIVTVDRNNFYIETSEANVRYHLVGLKKEEKVKLTQLEGNVVRLVIRVVSTKSAKAYNAQLIRILKKTTSTQEVAEKKSTEPNTTGKTAADGSSNQQEKNEKIKTSQKISEQDISEQNEVSGTTASTGSTQQESSRQEQEKKNTVSLKPGRRIIFTGTVYINRNVYYILDLRNKVRFHLVGLKVSQSKILARLNNENIKVEMNIIAKEREKIYKAQLIRIFPG